MKFFFLNGACRLLSIAMNRKYSIKITGRRVTKFQRSNTFHSKKYLLVAIIAFPIIIMLSPALYLYMHALCLTSFLLLFITIITTSLKAQSSYIYYTYTCIAFFMIIIIIQTFSIRELTCCCFLISLSRPAIYYLVNFRLSSVLSFL